MARPDGHPYRQPRHSVDPRWLLELQVSNLLKAERLPRARHLPTPVVHSKSPRQFRKLVNQCAKDS